MPKPFRLATWNILATAYIRSEFYPHTTPQILDARTRIPAVVRRAGELAVDILCMQEVEAESFAALEAGLVPLGYSGRLATKGARKPDGCATFFRNDVCVLEAERRLLYTDGGDGPASGHIAQILTLNVGGVRLDLINTHLKWDSPRTPRDLQWGYKQISQAISSMPEKTEGGIQVICGDFNVKADSPVITLLTSAGFERTHHPASGVYTCNSSGEPKLIDYICFRGNVAIRPVALPVIDRNTPLPSPEHPSDHLPLSAGFAPAS